MAHADRGVTMVQASIDLQALVSNRLDPAWKTAAHLAGIIGDRPSQYAKSPSLWNAVFGAMGWEAVYLAFDVDEPNLAALMAALRQTDRLLGASVTVPYKVKVIAHLDGLDEKARQIGAVNTVVRSEDGRLVGYNTDGLGFLHSLTNPVLPGEPPAMRTLDGLQVLMVGSGGAARAVAFYLGEAIGRRGHLTIANRTRETAQALAQEVSQAYGNASIVDELQVGEALPSVDLVVNCSTKGQAGVRRLPGGRATVLEPYSALASANPASFPQQEAGEDRAFLRRWFEASLPDIKQNNRRSAELALRLPPAAVAYDLIYSPLETVFLRHCRMTGHRTANGKGMNIAQAVDAFCDKVCRGLLRQHGLEGAAARQRVAEIMTRVW